MKATRRYHVRRTVLAAKDIEPEVKVAATILMEALNWKRNSRTFQPGEKPEDWLNSLAESYGYPVENLQDAFVLLLQRGWMKLYINEDGTTVYAPGELPEGFPSHEFEKE